MSLISKLIDNIYAYGNCKVYFPATIPNEASVIEFKVGINGELNITHSLEKYTQPIWTDGLEPSSTSYCISKMKYYDYSKEELPKVLSTIVYSSFAKQQESSAQVAISADEEKTLLYTERAVAALYQEFTKMLDLDSLDQRMWSMLNRVGFQQLLVNKSRRDGSKKQVEAHKASEIIGTKEQEILFNFKEAEYERIESESDIYDVITEYTSKVDEKQRQLAKLL